MTERFRIQKLNGIYVWTAWDTQGNAPHGELFANPEAVEKEVAKLNKSEQPPFDSSRPMIGLYARISEDSEEKGEGVLRQLQDQRKLADKLNAQIADYYIDNDTSASTRTNVPRPDYARLLKDASTGRIQLIGGYSNGRITRRPLELEDLIVLYDTHKTVIHTVVSGQDDLSTADGRMVARIKASVDAAEVERLAERVTRQKKQRAEQGLPQGGRYRVYGYTKDWELIPHEAAVIKEAFERRADGESMTSICKDFTKRELKTVAGNDWKPGTMVTTLSKATYAGLRSYKGEIIGPSTVPAIVSEVLYNSVQSELIKDSKGTNARKHTGSGFLICKSCLTQMKGNSYTGNYRCSTTYGGCGKVSIRIKQTDRYILQMVMNRHVANREKKPNTPTRDFNAEITAIETAVKKLQTGYEEDVYTLKEVQPMLKEQREKLKAVQKEQAKAMPTQRIDYLKTYMDFYKSSPSQKRVFIQEYVDNIVVHPRGQKGNHVFNPLRLEFHFTDGSIEFPDPGIDPEDV